MKTGDNSIRCSVFPGNRITIVVENNLVTRGEKSNGRWAMKGLLQYGMVLDQNHLPAVAAVVSQVTANAVQRQILANFRLGVNTGEKWTGLVARFGLRPLTLISGLPHRLTLQMFTQGLPMLYNRTNTTSERPSMSPFMTALWMSTAGCIFEVSGLKQPIQDKATSLKLGDVQFWKKSHRVGACIIPLVLFRNSIYSKVVFGQNMDLDLYQRVCIAVVAGICTNPIDSAVNIVAYETAIAPETTSLFDIYRTTWKQFSGNQFAGQGLTRLRWVAINAMSGVSYRIFGVGGACIILSYQTGDVIQGLLT